MLRNACGRRFAAPSQECFSSSFIICRKLLFFVCRCCATFAVAASRRLLKQRFSSSAQRLRPPLRGAFSSNVSRHRSLFVGHCCSLFVVAAQRLRPPLRGAFATFLVMFFYYFQWFTRLCPNFYVSCLRLQLDPIFRKRYKHGSILHLTTADLTNAWEKNRNRTDGRTPRKRLIRIS